MLTDKVAEPALQVLTTNSEAMPGRKTATREKKIKKTCKIFRKKWFIFVFVALICTCGSSLESRAVCRHHAGVSNQPGVAHSHVKGASRNVASIELDIYGVDSVLPWNEADCILVWTQHNRKGYSKMMLTDKKKKAEVYFVL